MMTPIATGEPYPRPAVFGVLHRGIFCILDSGRSGKNAAWQDDC
jgi:hypothetical protein